MNLYTDMSYFVNYSPEQDFLNKFQNLADMLSEDNYQNMKNLNFSNHNFNEVFMYLKAIIKQAVVSYRELANRTIQLETQLAKKDPFNMLLMEKTNRELNFGEAGIRLNAFVPLKSKKSDSFARKIETLEPQSLKKSKTLTERQLIQEQFDLIEQFIHNHLKDTLVPDLNKQKTIHKNIIMNLYLRWSEMRGRKILANKAKTVKTKITQVLKKIFPHMDHNEHKYRGIGFKKDIVKQQSQTEMDVVDHDYFSDFPIESYEPFQGEELVYQDVFEQLE